MRAQARPGGLNSVITGLFIFLSASFLSSCTPSRSIHVPPSIEPNIRVAYVAAAPDTAAYDCIIVVTTGYADGVEAGMTGELWQFDPEFRRKSPARLQVIESDPYLSLCHAWGFTPFETLRNVGISFDRGNRPPADVLQSADSASEEGDYERAFYLYRRLQLDTASHANRGVCELLDYCANQLDAGRIGSLDSETESRYTKKSNLYRRLVDNHMLYCQYEAASEYLYKILRVTPEDQGSLQQFELLDSGRVFRPFFSDRWDPQLCGPVLPDSIESYTTQFDKYPTMVYRAMPEYPAHESLIGAQGVVKVKALVDTAGSVVIAGVYKGSGHVGLDEAAAGAAYECKFIPAIRSGEKADCWVSWDFAFILGL